MLSLSVSVGSHCFVFGLSVCAVSIGTGSSGLLGDVIVSSYNLFLWARIFLSMSRLYLLPTCWELGQFRIVQWKSYRWYLVWWTRWWFVSDERPCKLFKYLWKLSGGTQSTHETSFNLINMRKNADNDGCRTHSENSQETYADQVLSKSHDIKGSYGAKETIVWRTDDWRTDGTISIYPAFTRSGEYKAIKGFTNANFGFWISPFVSRCDWKSLFLN